MPHFEVSLEIIGELDMDDLKEIIGEFAQEHELDIEGKIELKGKRETLDLEYIRVE